MGRLNARRAAVLLLLMVGACRRGQEQAETAGAPAPASGEAHDSTFAWAVPDDEARVQVEVRNAAGIPGLARGVTRTLRAGGLDVVGFGSHDATSDSTLILVRRGSRDAAERVRDLLGRGVVREARDSARRVDVSVILGRDYAP